MIYVPISKLKENSVTSKLYAINDQVDALQLSIEMDGIKEPLIVQKEVNGFYTIISGIRRFRIAKGLGMEKVPAVIIDEQEITEDLIITHQIQRVKKPTEILREYYYIQEKFNLKQGRGKSSPLKEFGKRLRAKLEEVSGKSKMETLIKIHNLTLKYYGNDEVQYQKVMDKLDESNNLSAMVNHLEQLITERDKEGIIDLYPPLKDKKYISIDDFTVYQQDSSDLSQLGNETVQTIFTSPPYWNMRDYGHKDQLGLSDFDVFVKELSEHFDDCMRVLKSTGSLFVNLGDKIEDGQYYPLSHSIGIEMKKRGWIWNDTITWVKNNSQYTRGKRSSSNNEYILHFVKTPNGGFYYDTTWLNNPDNLPEEYRGFVEMYSTVGYDNNKKFQSVWLPESAVIRSNVCSHNKLRKECEERGIPMTHSAMFPELLPLMGIMTTSRPGDLVLDVFNGTGTTGVVANKLGRRYVGYDLNEHYIILSHIRKEMSLPNYGMAG